MNLPPPNPLAVWPPQHAATPPADPARARAMAVVVLVGAGIAGIGAVLPWISARSALGSLDVAGTDGDGKIALAAAAAIGLCAVMLLAGNKVAAWVPGLLSAAGLLLMGYEWFHLGDVARTNGNEYVRAEVGMGVYVAAAGFTLALIGAWTAES